MSLAESACYTIINVPDMEPFNEMQIKQDLGKNEKNVIILTSSTFVITNFQL
jgi:hypothetical protein